MLQKHTSTHELGRVSGSRDPYFIRCKLGLTMDMATLVAAVVCLSVCSSGFVSRPMNIVMAFQHPVVPRGRCSRKPTQYLNFQLGGVPHSVRATKWKGWNSIPGGRERTQRIISSTSFSSALASSRSSSPSSAVPSPESNPILDSKDNSRNKSRYGSNCIRLVDEETNCEVVLVGCFHGSPSSAADVEREILGGENFSTKTTATDVVALELCATRFTNLQKHMRQRQKRNDHLEDNGSGNTSPLDGMVTSVKQSFRRSERFLQLVSQTTEKRGWSTGIATFILGSATGVQSTLSGFTPGLEFITALNMPSSSSKLSRGGGSEKNNYDIVLADQTVEMTLERSGILPTLSMEMSREAVGVLFGGDNDCDQSLSSWDETQLKKSSEGLGTAFFGDPRLAPQHQINMGDVLTQNENMKRDVLKLLLPYFITMSLLLSFVLNDPATMASAKDTASFFSAISINNNPIDIFTVAAATATMITTALNNWDIASVVTEEFITLSLLFFSLYWLLAVPAAKIILLERDVELAKGIKAACRIAASKRRQQQQQERQQDGGGRRSDAFEPYGVATGGRVVAVLGLFHLNGVAQRLLASSSSPTAVGEESIWE